MAVDVEGEVGFGGLEGEGEGAGSQTNKEM
jgi:hypothetical protein